MPGLQVLHSKYSKTGKFTVIGSHLQGYNKNAVDGLLKQSKVTFPHYQGLNIKKAPCGRGIPHMVLFDHEGNIVGNGHISNLESEIKKLIKLAPNPGDFSPLTAEVDVKLLKREAAQLKLGRPVKSGLASLARKAAGKDAAATEAQAIIDAVNAWGEKELADTEKLKATAPTEAYSRLTILNKTFYGMPLVKDVPAYLTQMKRDKYLNYLLGMKSQFDRLKTDKKITQNKKDSLAKRYQQFIDKYPASEALKSEAANIIKQIQSL